MDPTPLCSCNPPLITALMLNDTNWEFLRHLTNFSCQNKVVNWVAFTFSVYLFRTLESLSQKANQVIYQWQ